MEGMMLCKIPANKMVPGQYFVVLDLWEYHVAAANPAPALMYYWLSITASTTVCTGIGLYGGWLWRVNYGG